MARGLAPPRVTSCHPSRNAFHTHPRARAIAGDTWTFVTPDRRRLLDRELDTDAIKAAIVDLLNAAPAFAGTVFEANDVKVSPYTVTLPDDAFLIQIKISRAELVNAQITFEQVLNVLGVDERGDALQDTDFLEELGAKIGIPAGETWAEYKTATPPEEVVLAPPAAPSSLLTQVPDQKESFQETDEKGSSLEGGGIAGIVIGVLIGLVALGVGWVYKRSQQKRIPMKEYLKNSLSTSRTTSRVELNEGSTNDIERIKAKYRNKKADSDDSPAAVMPTGQERQTLSEKV